MDSETQYKITPKINVFKNQNYSLLFWGVFVSNVAHIIFNFAISLYILELSAPAYGQDNAAMIQAMYLALSGFVLVFLMPFGGVLADKLNKVRTMYLTDFIRGSVIIIIGIILIFDISVLNKIILLFIMNLILSINAAFFSPASSSLLRFVVSDEELQPAASLLQGSHNFQAIIGLILGGILYSILGIVWIFIINGVGYLISAFTEMFIRYDHHQHSSTDRLTLKIMLADIVDGTKYLFKQRAIVAIMMMALSLNFFLSPVFSNALPIFVKFKFAYEESYLFMNFMTPENWYSIISVSLSVAAIIMALILSRSATKEKYGKDLKKALVGFVAPLAVISITMILYYADRVQINVVLIILISMMFLIGLASVAFNIPTSLIMQRKIERNMLGKISSVSSVLSQALIPISSLVAGLLISQINVTALYLFCLIGMIVITTLYVFSKAANEI